MCVNQCEQELEKLTESKTVASNRKIWINTTEQTRREQMRIEEK